MDENAKIVIVLLSAVCITGQVMGAERAAVLYHGDALEADRTSLLLHSDPMLEVTRVPSHAWRSDYDTKTIQRFLRLYMPRRYEDLAGYGLIILSDASSTIFSPRDLEWFSNAVTEDGVSLAMIGGYDSFGGSHDAPGWSGTTVEEILPIVMLPEDTGTTSVRTSVKDGDNPLMKAVQDLNPPLFTGMNIVQTRQGAALLATGISLKGEHPLVVYWDVPRSRVFALTADWNGGWGENLLTWPDYPTYASLTTYFAAQLELPAVLAVYRSVRNLFYEYPSRRGLTTSVLEFVERFGVSSAPVLDRVAEIDAMKAEAEEAFLSQEYEEALSMLHDVNEEFALLSVELVKLKERALFWVYVVEWLVVSGAAMVCGGVLWTLMVKRRLYREVRVTRAR